MVHSWQELKCAIEEGTEHVISIDGNGQCLYAEGTICVKRGVTLVTSGAAPVRIMRTTRMRGSLFSVSSGILMLRGSTEAVPLIIDGGSTENDPLITITSGTVYLGSYCTIQNAWAFENGGAIYAISDSNEEDETITITINGATLSHNKAKRGGAVYAEHTTSFTVKGSTISENTAEYGGGVYLAGKSVSFFECDATSIQNNSASAHAGAGANVFNGTQEGLVLENGIAIPSGAGI